MIDFVKTVSDFMTASDQTVDVHNSKQAGLYLRLVNEELGEFKNPASDENELKELCDLIWVLIGFGLSKGWDVSGAFSEVGRSNMSKVGPDGRVMKNYFGKVIKPEYYMPPDVRCFLNKT